VKWSVSIQIVSGNTVPEHQSSAVRETEVLNRGHVHMVLGKDMEGSGRDIRHL